MPDGYNPDPQYILNVRPGGFGAGCEDHKVLYNYKKIEKIMCEQSYNYELLEYFDGNGNFHQRDWSTENGIIRRSNKYGKAENEDPSLIFDCIVPFKRPYPF